MAFYSTYCSTTCVMNKSTSYFNPRVLCISTNIAANAKPSVDLK